MLDPALSSKLDTAGGDPGAWAASGLKWTHLDEVRALINRRVSSGPSTSAIPAAAAQAPSRNWRFVCPSCTALFHRGCIPQLSRHSPWGIVT